MADRQGEQVENLVHVRRHEMSPQDPRKMNEVLVERVARCADGSTPDCPILKAPFDSDVGTEARV